MKIINIHITKTAGTSFRKSISEHFFVLEDYGNLIDRSESEINSEFFEFNRKLNIENFKQIDCIFGHITPIKYEKLYNEGWKFITWIRDPLQRMISHYYHKERENKINISLEEFLFSKDFKNFNQRFFYNFPPENYFFIGIVENYQSDLEFLSNLLGIKLKTYNENENSKKKLNYYEIPLNLINDFKNFHKKDYDIYNKFLEKSNQRKC